jgi:hypothetical protein
MEIMVDASTVIGIILNEKKSPFDIEGINTDITTKEVIEIIRECREGPDYFKQKYK